MILKDSLSVILNNLGNVNGNGTGVNVKEIPPVVNRYYDISAGNNIVLTGLYSKRMVDDDPVYSPLSVNTFIESDGVGYLTKITGYEYNLGNINSVSNLPETITLRFVYSVNNEESTFFEETFTCRDVSNQLNNIDNVKFILSSGTLSTDPAIDPAKDKIAPSCPSLNDGYISYHTQFTLQYSDSEILMPVVSPSYNIVVLYNLISQS